MNEVVGTDRAHPRAWSARSPGYLLDLDTADGPDAVLGLIVSELSALLALSGLPTLPVIAIGIGVPRPVEPTTALLSRARSMPGWENVPVPAYFAGEFPDVPVVDNAPVAVELMRQAGRDIGEILALTISEVNLSAIIVGGNLAESPESLLAGIREIVYSSSHPFSTSGHQIVPSSIGAAAGLLGAVHLALSAILSPAAVDQAISEGRVWR